MWPVIVSVTIGGAVLIVQYLVDFGRQLQAVEDSLASHHLAMRAAVDGPYPLAALDHRFVSVDASGVFVRGHGPAGAHSDHLRPESAHLLLSLADHAR